MLLREKRLGFEIMIIKASRILLLSIPWLIMMISSNEAYRIKNVDPHEWKRCWNGRARKNHIWFHSIIQREQCLFFWWKFRRITLMRMIILWLIRKRIVETKQRTGKLLAVIHLLCSIFVCVLLPYTRQMSTTATSIDIYACHYSSFIHPLTWI